MIDHRTLQNLLGRPGTDPGCDACFDVMDEVAEAQAHGEDTVRRFPEFAAHLRDCAACREDFDGLRAQLSERPDVP
jgi:hypothetical protein